MKIVVGPFKNKIIITLNKEEAKRVKDFFVSSLNYHSLYGGACPFMGSFTNRLSDIIKKTWGE